MDTKNNTKKKKKILWLSTFLIVVVVVVSFVIHLRINGALLPEDTQDIINRYKETIIESVQIPGIIESEKTIENKEDTKKILELQNTIKDLQKRIDSSNSNTTNYNQVIKFVVAGSLLSNKLQTNESFSKEIEDVLNTSPKAMLKTKLDKIKPYSDSGIKTQEDLIKDYQKVYQHTYSTYLKEDPSLIAKIKSYFLYLVFVKKTHTDLIENNTVANKLANVETYLRKNDFKKAYAEFIKIEVSPSKNTEEWMMSMQSKIEANEVLAEINKELNNYINLGSK